MPYADEDDAVAIANDSDYGLSGAVWSVDPARALRVGRRIETGRVVINGGPFNVDAPTGGAKQSGNGRELGVQGLLEYLEVKVFQLVTGDLRPGRDRLLGLGGAAPGGVGVVVVGLRCATPTRPGARSSARPRGSSPGPPGPETRATAARGQVVTAWTSEGNSYDAAIGYDLHSWEALTSLLYMPLYRLNGQLGGPEPARGSSTCPRCPPTASGTSSRSVPASRSTTAARSSPTTTSTPGPAC